MPRLHFKAIGERPDGYLELLIARPAAVPAGYTPVMLVSEWLTLNCRRDWASRSTKQGVRVRFADETDQARAAARFHAPEVVVELAVGASAAPRLGSGGQQPPEVRHARDGAPRTAGSGRTR